MTAEIQKILDEKFNEQLDKLASKECINELKIMIQEQKNIIESQKTHIARLEGTVSVLQESVSTLIKQIEICRVTADNNEQYSRRTSVRITGIPPVKGETSEDCLGKVQKVFDELVTGVATDAVDQAHRVGKIKKGSNGKPDKQAMVKFISWRDRTKVYRARPTSNSDKSYRIQLDLTKRRLGVLSEACQKFDSHDNVQFIFADVNCNLVAKLKDESFFHFDNIENLSNHLALLHIRYSSCKGGVVFIYISCF